MENDTMPDEACRALLVYLLEDEHALRQQLGTAVDLEALLRPRSARTRQAHPTGAADPDVRWFSLLGDVLWEIFSHNNEVIDPDGRRYDLGSWRGSGGFIADVLNAHLRRVHPEAFGAGGPFDYIDFYMGLMIPSDDEAWEVPLRMLYGHVFERLKRRGCTWRYASPGPSLLRFKGEAGEQDPAASDPVSAVGKALEEETDAESDQAEDEPARSLAEANEAAYRRAVREPPRIVRAYRDVYGEMPPYSRPGA